MTAEEIVEKDREALYIGNTRTVEFDLPLPKKGVYGSDIRWISGHDRIITPDGTVTRPKFGMGTRTIKLTAVITCGDAEAERSLTCACWRRKTGSGLRRYIRSGKRLQRDRLIICRLWRWW